MADTAADPTLPFRGTDADAAPVRFYAAALLRGDDDRPLGTLCVIAHHPRTFTGAERRTLLLMGVAASQLLARCRRPGNG